MKRREFSLLSSILFFPTLMFRAQAIKPIVKIQKLKKGDTIGLIAPASRISKEKIEEAKRNILNLGFKYKVGKHLNAAYGYLAGKDENRIDDLHSMYKDQEVKAIWCIRGGYGCTRLIDSLDYTLIRRNPKALIGFSDITALHISIFQETGIIGFHGPNASSEPINYNQASFKALLMDGKAEFQFEKFDDNQEEKSKYQKPKIWRHGLVKGRLTGGNLSLLAAITGTKHQAQFEDRIVLIEDVGEEPYRIDRMLTQLISATDIAKAKAIILGQFKGCNPDNPEMSLSLVDCLKDRLMPLGIPIIYGLNFGHVKHNFTFPIGGLAYLDTRKQVFKVIESCIV